MPHRQRDGYSKSKDRRGLGVAPRVGLEPTTCRLTAGCSTIELSGIGSLADYKEGRRQRLTIVLEERHADRKTRSTGGGWNRRARGAEEGGGGVAIVVERTEEAMRQ